MRIVLFVLALVDAVVAVANGICAYRFHTTFNAAMAAVLGVMAIMCLYHATRTELGDY